MKNIVNTFKITIPAVSKNESFCRSISTAFLSQADPTVEEIADVKTVISEAVTNCIVHAYKKEKNEKKKLIYIQGIHFSDNSFRFRIRDNGCGIEDVNQAMKPLYTTDSDNERTGMGLPIMQTFSDTFKIKSIPGKGTLITFTKKISSAYEEHI